MSNDAVSEIANSTQYCVFNYLYRDAGNWKTWGAILLSGAVPDDARSAIGYFDGDGLFVAEQLGVDSLCSEHFNRYGGPTDLDHAYHEFHNLRSATPSEIASMPQRGSINHFLARLREINGRWNVQCSPNAWL